MTAAAERIFPYPFSNVVGAHRGFEQWTNAQAIASEESIVDMCTCEGF